MGFPAGSAGSTATDVGGGALSGATTGSIFGPIGTAVGALVGAGVGAFGAYEGAKGATAQAQSQSNMYNYQAGVAQVNAQIAKQDANYAISEGEVSGQEAGMRTRGQIGATRAGFGASNVAGASKNNVISSEIEVGQQTQGIIASNAAKKAYGFQVGAAGDVATAGADVIAGQTSITSGGIAATQSILGGVSSVSSKWLQMGPAFGGGGTKAVAQATDPTYSNYGFNVG